jgi:hypothetical protein
MKQIVLGVGALVLGLALTSTAQAHGRRIGYCRPVYYGGYTVCSAPIVTTPAYPVVVSSFDCGVPTTVVDNCDLVPTTSVVYPTYIYGGVRYYGHRHVYYRRR